MESLILVFGGQLSLLFRKECGLGKGEDSFVLAAVFGENLFFFFLFKRDPCGLFFWLLRQEYF